MRSLMALAVWIPALALAQVPGKVGYQGRLLKSDGTPEGGVVKMTFSVYSTATGGTALWSEDQSVAMTEGFYATFLGDVKPFTGSLFDGTEKYLEIATGGVALTPRQRIGSVPYAIAAQHLVGGKVDAASISVNGKAVIDNNGKLVGTAAYSAATGSGLVMSTKNALSLLDTCKKDEVLKFDGTTWACSADKDTDTLYGAGPGIVIDAANTISLPTTCTSGQILKWTGSKWECKADSDSAVFYSAGSGIAIGGANNAISLIGTCTSGQILKWDGNKWACANDDDAVTMITAGSGINISGANNTISLPTTCTSSQILKWSGSKWECKADSDSAVFYSAGAGIAIGGANNAISLIGTCTSGQILKWDGSRWACANDDDTATMITAGSGINVSGANNTISLLGTCTAGQILKWNGTNWACATDVDTNSGGTVASVTASAPLSSTGGLTPNLALSQANGTTNGFLSSADWTTFNGKVGTTDPRLSDQRDPQAGSASYIQNGTASQSASFNISGTAAVTGKMGIGTASPDHSLQVAGDMRLDTSKVLRFGSVGENGDEMNLSRVNVGGNSSNRSDLVLTLGDDGFNGAPGTEDRFIIRTTNGPKDLLVVDGNKGLNLPLGNVTVGGKEVIAANGTINLANAVAAANGTTAGYLSSADWTTFNNKVAASDGRLTDDRNPKPGSANYIQNGTTSQPGSFNVSGTGNVGGRLSAGALTVTNPNGAITNTVFGAASGNNSVITLNSGADANYSYFLLQRGGVNKWELGAAASTDNGGGFYINNTTQQGTTNAPFYITSGGNIGLSTRTATHRVQLASSSYIALPSNGGGNVPANYARGNAGGIIFAGSANADGTGWAYGSRLVNHDYGDGLGLSFDVLHNGTWRNDALTITGRNGTGYVGLGTANPQRTLHVTQGRDGGSNSIFQSAGDDRPTVALRGAYPEVAIISNMETNPRHGATLRLAAYDNATRATWKHWVLGTPGANATFMDIGYAANDSNPHAGIDAWAGGSGSGRTVMRLANDSSVKMYGAASVHGDTQNTDSRYFTGTIERGWQASTGSMSYVTATDAPTGTVVAETKGYTWVYGPMMALDRTKDYMIEGYVKATLGSSPGTMYINVQEFDANGANIGGDGTDWYYPVGGISPPTTWTRYTARVGPGRGGKGHHGNARFISVGWIANYTTGDATYQFNGFRIYPVPDRAVRVFRSQTAYGSLSCSSTTTLPAPLTFSGSTGEWVTLSFSMTGRTNACGHTYGDLYLDGTLVSTTGTDERGCTWRRTLGSSVNVQLTTTGAHTFEVRFSCGSGASSFSDGGGEWPKGGLSYSAILGDG